VRGWTGVIMCGWVDWSGDELGWTGVGIMCGRMDWSGDDVDVWEGGLEWG
jgi:hypothetical protein